MSPTATSGAPPWAWDSYPVVAALASAALVLALGLAATGWLRRPARAAITLHAVVLVVLAIAIAWCAAIALGSQAPAHGQFCIAPSDWIAAPPPVCTRSWPIELMIATLAWPIGLAAATLLVHAVLRRHRGLIAASGAFGLAAVVARLAVGSVGLSVADLTSPGGIGPAGRAALDLALRFDTGPALLGVAIIGGLAAALRR